jgi:hypothetical protein
VTNTRKERQTAGRIVRSYDIKNHNIDATVNGTRLIVTDEITLQMREPNARFLPFDLFGSLRVKDGKGRKRKRARFYPGKEGRRL